MTITHDIFVKLLLRYRMAIDLFELITNTAESLISNYRYDVVNTSDKRLTFAYRLSYRIRP